MDGLAIGKLIGNRQIMQLNIAQTGSGRPYCSSSRRGSSPEWIVVHYTGCPGTRGDVIARRFARSSVPANDRLSSAHYVVDGERIWQCISLDRAAWHVGNGQPNECYSTCDHAELWHKKHKGFLGNRNSIGVELCVMKSGRGNRMEDEDWYFGDQTVETAAHLVAELLCRFDMSLDRILRHYDATGKPCPRPFVTLRRDKSQKYEAAWTDFRIRVGEWMAVIHGQQ